MKEYPEDFGDLVYDDQGKRKFLKMTAALLRKVGRVLKEEGSVADFTVSVNEAGIAVGGDVYGYFYAEGLKYGVLITIAHPGIASSRPDGVSAYGQYRAIRPEDEHRSRCKLPPMTRNMGPNVYIDPISEINVIYVIRKMLAAIPLSA